MSDVNTFVKGYLYLYPCPLLWFSDKMSALNEEGGKFSF